MPHCAARSAGRSHELSVTTPTVVTGGADSVTAREHYRPACRSDAQPPSRRSPPRRRGRRPVRAARSVAAAAPLSRSRRRRRKCPNHHDSSTSTAPPVMTWPRPVRALTRAVRTTGPSTVCSKAGRQQLDLHRRGSVGPGDDGQLDLGVARRLQLDLQVAVGERQLRRSGPHHDEPRLVGVVADVQAQDALPAGQREREGRAARRPSRGRHRLRTRSGRAWRPRSRRRGRSTATCRARPATPAPACRRPSSRPALSAESAGQVDPLAPGRRDRARPPTAASR